MPPGDGRNLTVSRAIQRNSAGLAHIWNGTPFATLTRMAGVTSFEELNAWKLSVELRDLVYTLIERGSVLNDPKFCAQIRNSASSAPSNISEGWGRFKPKQHANFVLIAKASLEETKNHLLHGRSKSYFSVEDFERAMRLNRRALGATVRFHQYLESCKGLLPWEDPTKQNSRRSSSHPKPGTGNREPEEPGT